MKVTWHAIYGLMSLPVAHGSIRQLPRRISLTEFLDSVDKELEKFLEDRFPKEVRAKRIEIETASGIEQFGSSYTHPSEDSCRIM